MDEFRAAGPAAAPGPPMGGGQRKEQRTGRAPRRRMRATYHCAEGVRHLLAACDRRRNEQGDSSPVRSMHPARWQSPVPRWLARLARTLAPAHARLCGLQHELRRPYQRKRHGKAHNPAPVLQRFFTDRLARQKKASPNTVAAYRDTCRLVLAFTQGKTGKAPSALSLADLNATLVVGAFLRYLEEQRGHRSRHQIVRRYFGQLHPRRKDRWVFGSRETCAYLPGSGGRDCPP